MHTPSLALTFDDVLIRPAYSEILPSMVQTKTRLTSGLELNTFILSSAMDTVTEVDMALVMGKLGGMGVLHKNMTTEAQAGMVKTIKSHKYIAGAAIGPGPDGIARAAALIDAGVDVLVVDTAHGHSKGVLDMVRYLRANTSVQIIAGNIATFDAAVALADAGVHAVKVGIGPGSICTTRIVAGIGVPQISAIMEVRAALKNTNIPIIADGGIRYSGDIAKALAAGASTVMLGSMLAGTDQAPGKTLMVDGCEYKEYRGMGSLGAMQAKHSSADRYFQADKSKEKLVPEGIEGRVLAKGPVENIIHQLVGGVQSAFGYVGAANITEFWQKAQFVQITTAGMRESHVHDVTITKAAPNYTPGN